MPPLGLGLGENLLLCPQAVNKLQLGAWHLSSIPLANPHSLAVESPMNEDKKTKMWACGFGKL